MADSFFDHPDRIFQSIRFGAVGYLLKSSLPDRLLEALIEAGEGGAPMWPPIARKMAAHFSKIASKSPADYRLRYREMEVLAYLFDGLSFKLFGSKLGISIAQS